MTLYDSIGNNYNSTRQADARIVDRLISLLDLPTRSKIADVGAGTGNYSNAIAQRSYEVIEIEPSQVMQNQQQDHPQVSWLTASAEQIPLADNSVDGAVVMLALHHFRHIEAGIREINRITSTGKIVIFAFEQSKIPEFWLTDYFPYFARDTANTFPSTQTIAELLSQITQKEAAIMPFLLPTNLSDLFAAAGWSKPGIYLNEEVQKGISSFAKMPQDELIIGLKRLRLELDNGSWRQKYGSLRSQTEYDAGYRLIATK
ncbi:MAG: class I SAM-dependent methyltransferase [Cyanobacteria bacterium J06623_7]